MQKKIDIIHDRLSKGIKLVRKSRPTIVHSAKIKSPPLLNPSRPLESVKQVTRTLKQPAIHAKISHSRSATRIVRNKKVAEIAVRGAPSVNQTLISDIQNTKIGKILVIVGNGPSKSSIPIETLKGHKNIEIMSINKPDSRIWPTDYWFFCDNSQHRRHQNIWDTYKGTIINASSVTKSNNRSIRIKTLSGRGFSKNLMIGFFIGRSSVYAAMQVALWMGYDSIFIFGVDMCAVGGKLYEWGSNPDVNDAMRVKRFKNESQSYDYAAAELPDAIRKKFFFCSKYNPFKFPDRFNRVDENIAINMILEKIDKRD